MSELGPIAQAVGRIAYEFALVQPLIPTYLHLLGSALLPIYAGAHASLSRPSSAAKPDKKSKKGSEYRSVNKRQRSELVEDRIPNTGDEEMESKLVARQRGPYPKFVHEQNRDENNGCGEKKRDQPYDLVAFA